MKKLVALLTVTGLCCAFSLADIPANKGGQKVSLRAAKPELKLPTRVARYTADGRIGKWMNYDQGGISQACGVDLVYDAFEPSASGSGVPTCGLYGVLCTDVIPCQYRWIFSGVYCAMLKLEDYTVKAGAEGALAERVEWLWWFDSDMDGNPAGDSAMESLLIAVTTNEYVEFSCTSPVAATGYGGVLFTFGAVTDGFYYTDADVCTFGLSWQMPTDGSGGWTNVMAQASTGTALILSTCGYMGMWGSKDPMSIPPRQGTAPWSQFLIAYDDDNPIDGTIDPFLECYSYAFALCPDPLSAALCFYQNEACSGFVCADANCSGTVDAEDIDPFFLAVGDAAAWQIQFPLCDLLCTCDVNGSGGVDSEDIDPFFVAVGLGGCP